jgi:hypothetical protein
MEYPTESTHESERMTFERYGLRWSVLAAWHADLRRSDGRVDPGIAAMIFASRTKIATGSFSTCEIGCDLARIEAALVLATASAAPERIDAWIERLAEAMADPEKARSREGFVPIRAESLGCRRPCDCPAA